MQYGFAINCKFNMKLLNSKIQGGYGYKNVRRKVTIITGAGYGMVQPDLQARQRANGHLHRFCMNQNSGVREKIYPRYKGFQSNHSLMFL